MKKHALAVLLAAAAASAPLWPTPAAAQALREPKTMLLDQSSETLIDAASAKALLKETVPAKVWKLYPEGRWTFLSQVAGGVTEDGICAVTARVVLLPRTGTIRAVIWRPLQVATAFDAKAGATAEQCRALARDKLKEATTAVVSALIKG